MLELWISQLSIEACPHSTTANSCLQKKNGGGNCRAEASAGRRCGKGGERRDSCGACGGGRARRGRASRRPAADAHRRLRRPPARAFRRRRRPRRQGNCRALEAAHPAAAVDAAAAAAKAQGPDARAAAVAKAPQNARAADSANGDAERRKRQRQRAGKVRGDDCRGAEPGKGGGPVGAGRGGGADRGAALRDARRRVQGVQNAVPDDISQPEERRRRAARRGYGRRRQRPAAVARVQHEQRGDGARGRAQGAGPRAGCGDARGAGRKGRGSRAGRDVRVPQVQVQADDHPRNADALGRRAHDCLHHLRQLWQPLVGSTVRAEMGNAERWIVYSGLAFLLVVFAGLMSGLTLGLLSQDRAVLEAMQNSGNSAKARRARRILPLLGRYHLLLVTLVLANAAAAETLPLVLNALFSPAVAIVLSVSLLLLLGEIVPNALVSRYALEAGSAFAWLIWALLFLELPVAWPIAKLLDAILGDHGRELFLNRGELRELFSVHRSLLTADELLIIRSALEMQQKTAQQIMTPLDSVFELDINHVLDEQTFTAIAQHGHSRLPVFVGDRKHIVAMLLVKNLVGVCAERCLRVRDMQLREIPCVPRNAALLDLLNLFQRGASHLAVVTEDAPAIHMAASFLPAGALGIVTLEDVIEELIGEEIVDETDQFVDVVKKIRVASRWDGNQ